jgi:hypothetical protein
MRRGVTFLTILVVIAACAASSDSNAQQSTARLLPDPSRSVHDSGGSAKAFTIRSAILGEARRIDVALPPSYGRTAANRLYPVAIVLDGEESFPVVSAVSAELARNGQIPEMIIVAIENTDRLRDLTPPGLSVSGSSKHEGGDRFLDFVEKELLPEVDRQLRGGAPRVLIGHSSGGILATYAAATRSTYRCVIALDTPVSLGESWLATKLVARAGRTGPPLRYVSYEARFGWSDAGWKALNAAAPSTWMLHREKLARESHESMPMLGMYLGLKEVFSDYSMLAAPVAPTTRILPWYQKVDTALGAAVIPPRKLLANVTEDLLIEGRGAAARVAYTALVAGYGAPADSGSLAARIADVERRPAPSETVEGLLATPFPSPDEARAWIGEWRGDIWMNADELTPGKPRSTLHVAVVDGRVVGETVSQHEPGVTDVQKWTYMKVTPNGLVFGYMNGMRPRGMLLHEGTMKDGVLSGVMRFGGVNFRFPDGTLPPPIYFSYKKVAAAGTVSRD